MTDQSFKDYEGIIELCRQTGADDSQYILVTLGDLEYLLGLERARRNVAIPECVIEKMEQQNEEFRRLQEYERSRSGKEQTDS